MAEEIGDLAADVLPLAAPLTEYLHTRYLRFFLEQDVVGHMESELGTPRLRPRPGAGRALLHRPHRLHPLHRGGGRPRGARRGRELRRDGGGDAAPRGDDREDDRRRGDGRLARRRLADRVGGRHPRAASRSGRGRGSASTTREAVYRDGDYFGTHVNLAHRVVSRAQAGEVLVTDRVVEAIEGRDGLALRADRRGQPEGLPRARPTLFVLRAAAAGMIEPGGDGMLEQVRDGGLLPPGRPRRRDALRRPRLGLPARPRGAPARARGGHGAARQLRPARGGRRRGRGALRRPLRAARGERSRSSARAAPRGPATCRPGRATPATRRRPGLAADAGGAPIATGHTADDQVETILYRLASSPSRRALLGMRATRRQAGAAAARLHPGADDRLLRGARPRLARRRDQRGAGLRPQPRPPRARCRRSPRSTRRRRANVLRTAELLRDEAEVLDALVDAELDGSRRRRRATRSRSSGWASCRRRCAASSSSGSPTAPPAGRCPARRATPRRSRPCAAPGTAMLDLGGGVRAVVERGVLRAERG